MSNLPLSFLLALIKVQNTTNDLPLQHFVIYSLNAVKTYHTLPVVLVFGTNKISHKCFIISKENIPDNDYHSCLMNSLFGLSLFLLEQQLSLHPHTYSKGPTVILLYQIAFAELYPQETY
ncbi:hypothetical protein J3Q64DRAFT_1252558 [Phycomyces blakesleeanus]|uniref:Uncharacterized protein n=1 Tax=Phycomyces blakesleeanus TaxID=4837 RepID=A0ABR3AQ06_PHYBL